MFDRGFWCVAMAVAVVLAAALSGAISRQAGAGVAQAIVSPMADGANRSLLHKADTFRNCQQIYWCSLRRDGTTRCGPTLRCRTCGFIRTCRRSTGCVWEEKCRWGPYVPPQPQ